LYQEIAMEIRLGLSDLTLPFSKFRPAASNFCRVISLTEQFFISGAVLWMRDRLRPCRFDTPG
jgi:hypothetical protein